jgi:acyl-CoA reductase-like NAD-dependent aldehyde dehydrogenase
MASTSTRAGGSRKTTGGDAQRNGSAAATGWDYAPAPETVPVSIAEAYGHYIDGAFTKPAGGSNSFETVNPATEDVLARVSAGTKKDVDAAVSAARAALPKWAKIGGAERGKYLFRIARRLQERAREFAVLETMDGGKPIKESRDVDVPLAAHHFFYHAGWADKLRYAFPGANAEPVGVCGQIIPWNFPLLMLAWKIAPALACGNTVVLKPAETTPLTALRLAEICDEVELPAGVVNILTGAGETGEVLASHPGLDKIAFTGSTAVGKKIAAAAAERGIPATLELGGKSTNIVFEDASIDQAVEGIVRGIYFNQGHVCCAGSRLLVQESVVETVVAKLEHRMKSLRVGDPLDKNTDVGAINSKAQLATIRGYIEAGEGEGAERRTPGGGRSLPKKGYWCEPTFFTGVHQSHRIAREEIFGPVLAVITFRTPDEAVQLANNTTYGLSAGVWTDKGSKMFHTAAALNAGVVWCNTFNNFDPAAPFGGYKESGVGREGGVQGLRGYVVLK